MVHATPVLYPIRKIFTLSMRYRIHALEDGYPDQSPPVGGSVSEEFQEPFMFVMVSLRVPQAL